MSAVTASCSNTGGTRPPLLPLEHYPLMRWRMRQAADGQGIYQQLARFGREQQPLIRQVLQAVREQGALGAGSLSTRQERAGPWWDWSAEKHALEWLFAAGELTVAGRRGFERLYDLPERVFPRNCWRAPSFRRHRPSASCCGWRRAPWAWPPKRTCATTIG